MLNKLSVFCSYILDISIIFLISIYLQYFNIHHTFNKKEKMITWDRGWIDKREYYTVINLCSRVVEGGLVNAVGLLEVVDRVLAQVPFMFFLPVFFM